MCGGQSRELLGPQGTVNADIGTDMLLQMGNCAVVTQGTIGVLDLQVCILITVSGG